MTNVEFFQSNVSELRIDNGRGQVLSEIKLDLNPLDVPQQTIFAQDFQLEEAFQCLNSSREDEIDAACKILSLLLNSMDPKVVLEQHLSYLKSALCHPNISARKMSLGELCRAACSTELIPLITQNDILMGVIASLNGDTALAKSASTLLVKVGGTHDGLRTILSGDLLKALKDVQNEGFVSRFRVFEVVVLIAAHSPEAQEFCIRSGFLDALAAELEVEDILMQVNTVDLLIKLASQPHGIEWLSQFGIFGLVADRFTFIQDEPLECPLLPGMLKLFGLLAQKNPKDMFYEYPVVVSVLFDTFCISDIPLLLIAMETVGCIAKSVKGKFVLYNMADQMNTAIKIIAQGIEYYPPMHRARALRAMANIIELKIPDQEIHTLEITKDFFHWLSDNPMSLIMTVFRKSFPKLRLAGLHLIKMLAEQEWGQILIRGHSGVIDFLLDRNMETERYCKNVKFAICKTIIESPTGASVFELETVTRLWNSIQKRTISIRNETDRKIKSTS